MGIGNELVRALAREHVHKPVYGDVLLIGRQTVYFTPEQILTCFSEHGIDTRGTDPKTIELDKSTVDRRADASGATLISDRALFKLLGINRVLALDHSDYEKADIIHDLRRPLPTNLHGVADLVVDGSTLDNVFTPSETLQSYCKLLRPGGRLLTVNAFSGHDSAYAIMPPLWYVDYFVMNRFADCRVYVIAFLQDCLNAFYVDLEEVQRSGRQMGRFRSPFHMATLVFAEKDAESTSDRLPIQQDYRSDEDWKVYRANLARMLGSKRPHLIRSNSERFVADVTPGHLFMDQRFTART